MKFSAIKDKIKNNPGFKSLEEIKEAGYRIVKERDGDRYFLAKQEELKPLLVRLGDIAEVKFGIKTGANEFFYLPSKHFDIRKEGKYYELIPKSIELPTHLKIEEKYLIPILKTAKDSLCLNVDPSILKTKLLYCHNSRDKLIGEKALEYIKWGEDQQYHKISSVRNRKYWYDIGIKQIPDGIILRRVGERMPVFYSNGVLEDNNLFGVMTTGIAGGLLSPKRAVLLAPLKGVLSLPTSL